MRCCHIGVEGEERLTHHRSIDMYSHLLLRTRFEARRLIQLRRQFGSSFVSGGCLQTGDSPAHRVVRSLAEQTLDMLGQQ